MGSLSRVVTTLTPPEANGPSPESRNGDPSRAGPGLATESRDGLKVVAKPVPAPTANAFNANAFHAKLYVRLTRAGDLAIALTVLLAAFVLTNTESIPQGLAQFLAVRMSVRNVLIIIAFAMLWRGAASLAGLYDRRRMHRPRDEAARVLLVCTVMGLVVLPLPLFSDSGAFGARTVALFWAALVAGILAGRVLFHIAAVTAARETRHVIIVGSGPRALHLSHQLEAHPTAFRILGFVDTNPSVAEEELGGRLLGSLDELERILMSQPIDEVLITLPVRSRYGEIQDVIDLCEQVGVPALQPADIFRASGS